MEKGLEAAIQQFPQRVQEIRRLALADSTFRSLCADLADAEVALRQWTRSTTPQSEQRRREYRVLVLELADELEHMLNAAQTAGRVT